VLQKSKTCLVFNDNDDDVCSGCLIYERSLFLSDVIILIITILIYLLCVFYFVFTSLLYLLFCLHSKSESDICL